RLEQVLFQIAHVLADKIRNDEPVENRVQHIHAAVIDRNSLRAVFGSDPHEMIFAFAKQLDGFDDNRILECADSEHGLSGGLRERGIRNVCRNSRPWRGKRGESTCRKSAAEEFSAIGFHALWDFETLER